jgi:hypothetical protein
MTSRSLDPDARLHRRTLLRAGAGLLAGVAPLVACGKKYPTSCMSVDGLSDAEKKARETLQYVDMTSYADKTCATCQHWIVEAAEGECGGCKLVKGPIHPRGYCTIFVKQA